MSQSLGVRPFDRQQILFLQNGHRLQPHSLSEMTARLDKGYQAEGIAMALFRVVHGSSDQAGPELLVRPMLPFRTGLRPQLVLTAGVSARHTASIYNSRLALFPLGF